MFPDKYFSKTVIFPTKKRSQVKLFHGPLGDRFMANAVLVWFLGVEFHIPIFFVNKKTLLLCGNWPGKEMGD